MKITIVSPAGTTNSTDESGDSASGLEGFQANFTTASLSTTKYEFDEALTNSTIEKLSVSVNDPSHDGLLKLLFTRQVALISNMTDWTDKNEGAENIKIQLDLSEETRNKLEDQDLEIDLSWRVVSIENFTTSQYEFDEESSNNR